MVSSIDFDGTDAEASASGLSSSLFASDYAIEVVLDPDSIGGGIIGRNNWTALLVNFSGNFLQFGTSNGGWGRWDVSNVTKGKARWRFVHDTTETGFDRLKVYRNGQEMAQAATVGTYSAPSTDTGDVHIGQRGNDTTYFDGGIEDVRVWTRAVTPSDADQASDLELHLENATGTTWTDSENSNDFTLAGGFTIGTSTPGDTGNAVSFDGSSGYAIGYELDSSLFSGEFTIEWEQTPDSVTTGAVISRDSYAGLAVLWSGGKLNVGTSSYFRIGGVKTVGEATAKVRVVFDPADTGNEYRIYFDGVEESSYTTSGTYSAPGTNTGDVTIGQRGNSSTYFDGQIKNLKVWTRVVTPGDADQTSNVELSVGEVNTDAVWTDTSSSNTPFSLVGTYTVEGDTPLVEFNGSTAYASASGIGSTVFSGSYTIEFALNPDSITAGAIIARGSYANLAVFMSSSKLRFGATSAGWKSVAITQDVEAVWRLVHDTTETGFDRLRIFKNGIEIVSDDTDGTYVAPPSGSGDVFIGQRGNSSTFLDGHMREVRVWSRAVTPTDADQSSDLELQLRLVAGSNWEDISGNNDDFTLSGGFTASIPSAVTILTPVSRQGFQRNSSSEADIAVFGIANDFTGAIEAKHGSGSFSTITTISNGGVFSGTLSSQAAATGDLVVRSAVATGNSATASGVVIGDGYLVGGDSISVGRGTNLQSHGLAANLAPSVYLRDRTWKEANDSVGQDASAAGSHWPLLAKLLSTDSGVPVFFVSFGLGGRDIAGQTTPTPIDYFSKGKQGYTEILEMAEEAGGNFTAMLLHLGPNAAVTPPTLTAAQYRLAVETFNVDIQTDVQNGLPIYLGCFGENGSLASDDIKKGMVEAVNGAVNLRPGFNGLGPNYADNVHPQTDAELGTVAGRWFAALEGKGSPNAIRANLSADGLTVTVVFDADLDDNVTVFTASAWEVDSTNPTSVVRSGDRQVTLVFAAAVDSSDTLSFALGNTHLDATMPSGRRVTLPATVNTVSVAANPINPVYSMEFASGAYDPCQLSTSISSKISRALST